MSSVEAPRVEDLLRELAPQVLGALVRRYGQFDAAEDAVQEALLAAALQWSDEGVPDHPRPWLVTVASRRLVDGWRTESARRRREESEAVLELRVSGPASEQEDTLTLLFLCCHPALSVPSQLALTLRAVGGLTTTEIANAFLVPEATMAQRISRAKQRIKSTGARFDLPPERQRAERLRVVLQVLYLIFNEGYTSSSGSSLHRADLTTEAIRLTRMLHQLLPQDGEVAGLLALMLLTDARREARATADGSLVPLAEQDRDLWNADQIDEGVSLITGHARQGADRSLSAAGRDRRDPRRSDERRGDRLAADPRAVRGARTGVPGPRRHAEPRGRGRDGRWTARRPGAARNPRHGRPHESHAPTRGGPGAPARACR